MIYVNQEIKTFYLESKGVTYAFCVHPAGFLQHLYYGKRIHKEDLGFNNPINTFWRIHGVSIPANNTLYNLNAYAHECPTYGRGDFREGMVSFDFDGQRITDLVYDSYEILDEKPALKGMPSVKGKQTLVVTLNDSVHSVKVKLFYTVFEDLPVILRHTEVVNDSNKTIKIDRAYSFALDYFDKKWQTVSLFGAHGRERMIERKDIGHGVTCFDSKRGVSSSQMNPFLALVRSNTDEDVGDAYGFNLVYSGNFALKVQKSESDGVRVVGGINDFDFCWDLSAGDTFVTPEVVMVYSDAGLGKMSRTFHDLYREYLINPKYVKKSRPIVINNWEAMRFTFDTEKLCKFIDGVKGMGIDTFVLDDGWFGGEKGRDNERSGLGDWVVNEKKLNLNEVIDHTHKCGLKFGLWFEPEMASPNSVVLEKHPDWYLHADGIEPAQGRWSYALDLTKKEVRDYIVDSLSYMLDNYDIDYVKWDMNRSLTELCSEFNKETAHRWVLGLYEVLERLVNGYPEIFFEGCASGGCRFDPAVAYYYPQIWTSDNTDAYMRSCIQYGTGLCYPLSMMSCHVSVSPNHQCGRITPFSSRFAIARLGAFGYELDVNKLTEDDRSQIKDQVEEYKQTEDLILSGDLYRLNSPFEGNLFAEQIVSKDKEKSLIVIFQPISVHNEDTVRIYPKGLDGESQYLIKELDIVRSGDTIMGMGLPATLPKRDFESKTYHLIKQ